MATVNWSPKDPLDVRDYWIDFASLLSSDETISASVVTIAPTQNPVSGSYVDMALEEDEFAGKQVRIRVSGGSPVNASGNTPANYIVRYHITTTTGQEFDLDKALKVKERVA